MKPVYLLDSVILIDHLKGVSDATRWLDRLNEGEAAISVITRAEVLAGTISNDLSSVRLFLDQFECLSLTPLIADKAAALRQEHRWKLPDAIQAALALSHDLRLVTRNVRDFDRKKHAFVLVPYGAS